jgi:hypothetical protein
MAVAMSAGSGSVHWWHGEKAGDFVGQLGGPTPRESRWEVFTTAEGSSAISITGLMPSSTCGSSSVTP